VVGGCRQQLCIQNCGQTAADRRDYFWQPIGSRHRRNIPTVPSPIPTTYRSITIQALQTDRQTTDDTIVPKTRPLLRSTKKWLIFMHSPIRLSFSGCPSVSSFVRCERFVSTMSLMKFYRTLFMQLSLKQWGHKYTSEVFEGQGVNVKVVHTNDKFRWSFSSLKLMGTGTCPLIHWHPTQLLELTLSLSQRVGLRLGIAGLGLRLGLGLWSGSGLGLVLALALTRIIRVRVN